MLYWNIDKTITWKMFLMKIRSQNSEVTCICWFWTFYSYSILQNYISKIFLIYTGFYSTHFVKSNRRITISRVKQLWSCPNHIYLYWQTSILYWQASILYQPPPFQKKSISPFNSSIHILTTEKAYYFCNFIAFA